MHLIEIMHTSVPMCARNHCTVSSIECLSILHDFCRYACSVENRGVVIKVNGLNEKLPVSLLSYLVVLLWCIIMSSVSLFRCGIVTVQNGGERSCLVLNYTGGF